MDLIGKKCIVRTQTAGVFFGEIAERDGKEVTLKDARRIWYWSGAATLSQLATTGTSDPENCKFPVSVPIAVLCEVIEILPCEPAAAASIEGVKVWVA